MGSSWHLYLLAGAIAGEIAVAGGICLESPRGKTLKEWLGLGLVLGGVVLGAACTIGLFVFDEGITHDQQAQIEKAQGLIQSQQATIVDLTQRLTAVTGELALLEKSRELDPGQIAQVAAALKALPKVPVAVVEPFLDSTDAQPFGESIKAALKAGGFVPVDPPPKFKSILSFNGPGAWLTVRDLQHPPPGAVAIQKAFASVGTYLSGTAKPDEIPDPRMIVIVVSSHPFKPWVPPQ